MGYRRFWLGFDGRINRARYLLAALAILGAMIVAVRSLYALSGIFHLGGGRFSINLIVISATVNPLDDPPARTGWFPEIVTIPLTLAFAWAYVAVAIKRLHDRDKSGWWMVLFVGLTALYVKFGDRLSYTPPFTGLVSGLLLLWGFVEMGFLKGTGGPNRFGPDPLAPRPGAAPSSDKHGAPLAD